MSRSSQLVGNFKRVLSIDNPGNVKVIVLCILGASTFWLFNALNKDYTTNIRHPIEFDYDTENFIAVKDLPDELNLNLSGGGWNLLRRTNWFNIDPIRIPLQNPIEINRVFAASWRGIISDQLPDFRLNFVVTDSVSIYFQRKVRKKIPIKIDSLNAPLDNNYRIVSAIFQDVDSVTLIGPVEILDTLQIPYIIPISGNQLQSDFDRSVQVPVFNTSLVTAVPNQVLVQFEVKEFIRKTLRIPSQGLNFPDSTVNLRDSIVTISFNVREDMEDLIVADSFNIIADFERRVKSDSSIQPLIKAYPKLVDRISIDSDRLKIKYDQ